MKRLLIILSLIVSCGITESLSQTFTGTVLDKNDNSPLPFADIYFPDFKTGTSTNAEGVFVIEYYKHKSIHIQITYVGYERHNEIINLQNTSEKTFFLKKDHFEIEEVVVSAAIGRLQEENVANVDHKNITELHTNSSATLAGIISNIPGVEQNTTGGGIGKPVIRGLSGNRIVTYSQGIRVENQQWGDEHGLGIGEVGIESVEVIKGPASILYGSDALGGVLYFIDERYAKHKSLEGFLKTRFHSNSLGTLNTAGFKINNGQLKLNLFGGFSSLADYRVPESQRVFNTRYNEQNLKTSIGFTSGNWVSHIRYSYLKNNFGIVEDASYSESKDRDVVIPFQTIDNHALSLENIFFTNESKLNLTIGYSGNYRREFEDDANIHALGLKLKNYTYNFKWYSPIYSEFMSFVIGSQGMYQENKNNGEELLIPNGKTTDFGAFAVINLEKNNLQIQGGIRADTRKIDTELMDDINEVLFPAFNNSFTGFTFSSGGAYRFEKSKFRFNISSGFRAPNTSELLSNGVHEGTNRYEIGNQDLKTENAIQLDFTYEYKDDHFDFAVNPFYNSIKDYVYLSPTGMLIENNPVFEYIQTNASLYGIEISTHYHPHKIHWLHLESNLSAVFAEDVNNDPLPLIPQTKIKSTISAEISSTGKLRFKNLYIEHSYKFKQGRFGQFETATDSYHLINLGLSAEIGHDSNPIEISTGINNLFNTQYIDHLSRFKTLNIPNQGINFFIATKFNFNKNFNN